MPADKMVLAKCGVKILVEIFCNILPPHFYIHNFFCNVVPEKASCNKISYSTSY